MKKNRIIQWIWLAALLLTPIVLWILPAAFFDDGSVIVCPSRAFFDVECFGCGMTRAIMHIHHWDFDEALFYNYGSPVVYLGLIYIWFLWTFKAIKGLGLWPGSKAA